MSSFAYYPGCSLHATAREYDESLRAVAGKLGIGLKEIEDWVCCGATPAHAVDPQAAHLLGLWNLSHAAKCGTDPLLTGCASCFSRLRAVREEIRQSPQDVPASLTRAGLSVNPEQEVVHIAQVLAAPEMRAALMEKMTRSLSGLKVACYYGCLLTRPRGLGLADDPENPTILEDLVRLTGAEPVDWPLRLDCCGASMAMPRADLVQELSAKLLVMAKERGAMVMLVACPLCHSNLDFQQEKSLKPRGHNFRMPVLYLTQLIGLGMGLSPSELGLSRHFVPVDVDHLIPVEGGSHV